MTVGTLDFSFMGLLTRLQAILPETVEVVVQAGSDGGRLDWPGASVRSKMGHEELRAHVDWADVVVAHAGIGSALTVLEAGKVPVLVPRTQRLGEHVDDHQAQIARHLAGRDLAVVATSDTIGLDDLSQALARSVERTGTERKFVLL